MPAAIFVEIHFVRENQVHRGKDSDVLSIGSDCRVSALIGTRQRTGPIRRVPDPPKHSITPASDLCSIRSHAHRMKFVSMCHEGGDLARPALWHYLPVTPSAVRKHKNSHPCHISCGEIHRILRVLVIGISLFLRWRASVEVLHTYWLG